MSENSLTIIVDGKEIEAKANQTIMQAADAAGVYIPRLCYAKELPPGGHCRLCTVKVNGRAQSACTFPVADGQVIDHDTEELNALRRTIVEMLFVEGNHYCPSCEASGKCELQAMGYRLGLLAPQLPYFNTPRQMDATHKDVYLDRNRCILCGRCVRASRTLDGKAVFGFDGRGVRKRIAIDAQNSLSETSLAATDAAARLCPTGCIVLKRTGWNVPVGKRLYDHQPIGSDIESATTGASA